MDWLYWASVISPWLIILIAFIGKNWIVAKIQKGVEHGFNEKIELLRGELRGKEAEISALRDAVLSGKAWRQSLLDKRRLKAVEHVWSAITALTPFHFVSVSMAILDLEKVSERAPQDPSSSNFLR
jgi:hypothetical protein